MPFDVSISLSNTSWSVDEELKAVGPDETFSVPLAFCAASAFSIRPCYKVDKQTAPTYQWSQSILCKRQSHDFTVVKSVQCISVDSAPVFMQLSLHQKDRMLTITAEPFFSVLNALPCRLCVRVLSGHSNESCELTSGECRKLQCMNFSNETLVCVKAGSYEWSGPCRLNLDKKESCQFDLFGENNELSLVISMNISPVNKQLQLEFFTQSVIFDRSGLSIAVLGLRDGKSVLRRSNVFGGSNYLSSNDLSASINKQAVLRTRSEDKNIAKLKQMHHSHSSLSSQFADRALQFRSPAKHNKRTLVLNTDGIESFNIALIQNFTVASEGSYQVTVGDVGQPVYTDARLIWSYLPESLRRTTYISTPNADRNLMGRKHLQFDLDACPALVLLLVDSQLEHKWLAEIGFIRLTQQAIAVCVQDGKEVSFAILGRLYAAHDHVAIPANWSKTAGWMYVCFVVNVPADNEKVSRVLGNDPLEKICRSSSYDKAGITYAEWELGKIIEQVSFNKLYHSHYADSSWIDGKNGMSMFYAEGDIIALGIDNGSVWSDDLSISSSSSSLQASLEIIDWSSMVGYQLSYSLAFMPGVFHRTQQMTVFPTFVIVSCLQEMLYVRQASTDVDLPVKPFNSECWHKTSAMYDTRVYIRCESSQWSLGCVDLHQIGSNVLLLPSTGGYSPAAAPGILKRKPGAPIFLNVNVKMAEPGENAAIVIIIWESTLDRGSMALGIRNESDVPVCVRQNLGDADIYSSIPLTMPQSTAESLAGIQVAAEEMNMKRFCVCVNPGEVIPYGWADPEAPNEVLLVVGAEMYGPPQRTATVNMVHAGESMRFPDNSGRSGSTGEIILEVRAEHGGRILNISRAKIVGNAGHGNDFTSEVTVPVSSAMGISVFLDSFAVSLILDKPTRRELLNLSLIGLEVQVKLKSGSRSVEFMIEDMQIDNYSETAVHPVLFCRKKKQVTEDAYEANSSAQTVNNSGHGENGEIMEPIVRFTLVQDLSKSKDTVVYKYCACRVLAFMVRVDSASLQFLWYDLLTDLKYVSKDEAEAAMEPVRWADEYNRSIHFPGKHQQLADIFEARKISQASKMYFETLVIHPLKISFTFVQTPFPRTLKFTLRSTAVNVLTAFAGVENMELKLKSFAVEDALESRQSLTSHVVNSAIDDIQSQMGQIAGSLTVLGSPASFARNVGSGVKAFFYEPYQGAVESPNDVFAGFGKGMRKGTSHLFTEVVSGAMNSTVALVGTASKGISYLSGDADFVRKREVKRMRRRDDNIIDSLSHGSQQLASGFASGVSGLVKRPVEGAITGGFTGFLQGIGMGLVGAAVKPLLGFADGVTSVANGINNKVNSGHKTLKRRPARALERSSINMNDLIVVPLNLASAVAQDSVVERARNKNYSDRFISYFNTMNEAEEYVIISEMYLFWRSGRKLWGRMWSNISHCVLMENNTVGICLYFSSGDRHYQITQIKCYSPVAAQRLYAVLVANKTLMGNPVAVLPLDFFLQHWHMPIPEKKFSLTVCAGNGLSLNGEIDGYLFGSANGLKMREITGSAEDVIRRAEANLAKSIRFSDRIISAGGGKRCLDQSGSSADASSGTDGTSWKLLDDRVWVVIWEWLCTHHGLNTARCSATIIVNKSEAPFQIIRMRMLYGKTVYLFGSKDTGYDPTNRILQPCGHVVMLAVAYAPSPLEVGHLKVILKCTQGAKITIASTQSESSVECAASGNSLVLSLLEKTVSEIWSKYVVVVSSNWILQN
jgi:hypothetical protein